MPEWCLHGHMEAYEAASSLDCFTNYLTRTTARFLVFEEVGVSLFAFEASAISAFSFRRLSSCLIEKG